MEKIPSLNPHRRGKISRKSPESFRKMARTISRKAGGVPSESRKDSSIPKRKAGKYHDSRNGKDNQRISTRSCEVCLGNGIFRRKWTTVSESGSGKDRRERQLRGVRAAGGDRVHHAMEFSTLAMRPLCSTITDGG